MFTMRPARVRRPRLWTAPLCAALFGCLVAALVPPAEAQTSPISYIYDRLGRLVGVVDPATNEIAIYRYDAVGNLLSIARQSAAIVSIVEFTPSRGTAGTSVTISGTGFSATAAQNTVAFNGTTATIISASPTRLIATVPAGAMTGPITVAAPGGSAASDRPFTVATLGPPTITEFTPTIGPPSTPVTITGTNFDVPANDRVVFNTNVQPSAVTSATATTIQTVVPSTVGSGRILVATPHGQALSSQDFFVPPSPYTAADVAVATRTAVGNVTTVTLSTAGKVALLVFDGARGQRVSLGVTNATLSSFSVYVRRPDGSPLVSGVFTTSGGALDVPALPSSGTYTVSVQPAASVTGSVTLTLSPEVTGTLVVDGPAVPVSLGASGQNARFAFTGLAGQRLTLAVTGATVSVYISVLKPDGTTLLAPTFTWLSAGNALLDVPILPGAGTYTLFVDPPAVNTGSLTLLLSSEIVGSLALDGPAYVVSVTRAGQNARLSFAGTAGQRVSLGLTGITIPCCTAVSILKPDGTTLASTVFGASGTLDAPVLPVTGSYAVFVDPPGVTTGNATVTLSSELTGTLVIDGASVPLGLGRPGQNARLSFAGTAGQRLNLAVSSVTLSGLTVTILKPDGTTLVSTFVGVSGGVLDTAALPVTGPYTLFVDPSGVATGNTTLTLSGELTGTLAVNDPGVPLTHRLGQNARFTFTGTAGQPVTVRVTGNAVGFVTVTLLRPDNSSLTSATSSSASFNLTAQTLATSGTYTVTVDPFALNAGSLTLSVTSP